MSEILTDEEIIKKQCQYCHYLHLGKCHYEHNVKIQDVINGCNVFSDEVIPKVQGYFESVVIPARIAEAEKKGAQDMIDYLKQTKPAEVDEAIKLLVAEAKKELIKWLDEPDSDHVGIAGYYLHRRDCPECWQSIKEGKI